MSKGRRAKEDLHGVVRRISGERDIHNFPRCRDSSRWVRIKTRIQCGMKHHLVMRMDKIHLRVLHMLSHGLEEGLRRVACKGLGEEVFVLQ